MGYEKAQAIADPPLMICLHCKWYTVKRHYCCKDFRNPIPDPEGHESGMFSLGSF